MGIWGFLRQYTWPVVLAVVGAALWVLDMIGRYHEIMGMPGWFWQASAGALILLAVLLFFYQVHRRVEGSIALAATPVSVSEHHAHFIECDPPQPERIYEGAHEKLMLFVVTKLFPACSARRELTYAIIRGLCGNGYIAELADLGARLDKDVSQYNLGLNGLEPLGMSPARFIPFAEMIESVLHVEMGYIDYVKQANRLAQTGYMETHIIPLITNKYEDWRVAHNAMVTAYEQIKCDSRMGRLFRPIQESRWGGLLSAFTGAVPLPLMLREPEADKPQ